MGRILLHWGSSDITLHCPLAGQALNLHRVCRPLLYPISRVDLGMDIRWATAEATCWLFKTSAHDKIPPYFVPGMNLEGVDTWRTLDAGDPQAAQCKHAVQPLTRYHSAAEYVLKAPWFP